MQTVTVVLVVIVGLLALLALLPRRLLGKSEPNAGAPPAVKPEPQAHAETKSRPRIVVIEASPPVGLPADCKPPYLWFVIVNSYKVAGPYADNARAKRAGEFIQNVTDVRPLPPDVAEPTSIICLLRLDLSAPPFYVFEFEGKSFSDFVVCGPGGQVGPALRDRFDARSRAQKLASQPGSTPNADNKDTWDV